MMFYSLNGQSVKVPFHQAVVQSIAPDRGLYFPEAIPRLPASFFENIQSISDQEVAFSAMAPFVGGSLTEQELRDILLDVLSFDFPLVSLNDRISTLELFHGPTMAFKDVGARFMARCLGHFTKRDPKSKEVTVLVATSGDTGGAVARGFLNVPGVKVIILYPRGKVSEIQEKQLTTLGANIRALEVDGVFDDCQRMVKKAFQDDILQRHFQLTSANSINVARWLPQMIYYLLAYKKAGKEKLVFSVPSGNFGNICAGMVAHKMGMPVQQFIASVNSNAVVPHFMKTQTYTPRPAVATISNAMDVGDPSNFVRILELFEQNFGMLSRKLTSYSFSDTETRRAMKELYSHFSYVADPHGAVGYLGLQKYLDQHPEVNGVFLETAHPVKFLNVVEQVIQKELPLPDQIAALMPRKKQATAVGSYEEFQSFLLSEV
ncbi:threonine synthase [Croceiramulus getboli]|nr:threonine synthase [Flavobacteriaceae bacterium YJPT1-3]